MIKLNQKFGKWTVIEKIYIKGKYGRVRIRWKCECKCSNISQISSYDLIQGKSTQCRKCYGTAPKDLEGSVIGNWKVIAKSSKKNGKTHWKCLCTCGNYVDVCAASLSKKVSTQCIDCYQGKRKGNRQERWDLKKKEMNKPDFKIVYPVIHSKFGSPSTIVKHEEK